ncbi:hypothetical protein GALMADRAFT_881025 [Galerina marginata CBS 339.88]|uniref:Heat shock protein 70 n=1 Tax=Galerina marginata (strain CBS 339.88) TaxID=685588 RepID=A0A067SSL2_GALM3|nr:hypothetical protein GALMADRAFT_881025 [Galerina marginata CBS 339.88]
MAYSDAIGIDLGTSYSCVGVWDVRKGCVDIIPNDQGNRTTPTYVAFSHNKRLIGDAAKNQATFNPRNSVFYIKRLLGRKFNSEEVQSDLKHFPFEVFRKGEMSHIRVEHRSEAKELSPEEISAMFLLKMKETAEAYLGTSIDTAVVTVPAHFNHCQRQATKDAGTIAGLEVRLLNEPSAVAISACLDKGIIGERNLLICNFGGGTFDVSAVTVDEGIVEVKATAGDGRLGGLDFDNRLVNYFIQEFNRKFMKDISTNHQAIHRLRIACERAKRMLSSSTNTSIEIDSLFDGIDFYTSLTRTRFEELCDDLFRGTIIPVERVLRDSKIDRRSIHEIILIGGSSRMPHFVELLSGLFDGKLPSKDINPDDAVICGAAIQAAINAGERSENIQDLLLLDVVPQTLGIETEGGLMSALLKRNTATPMKKSAIFSTYIDNQPDFPVHIYEGERARVKDNNLIGKLKLSGISPGPRGIPQIEVTFDIDASDHISVSVSDKTSGKSMRASVVNNNCLSTEEIERMKGDAKLYNAENEQEAGAARLAAKYELESYSYGLRHSLAKLQTTVNDAIVWLETSQEASKEEYEERRSDMKAIANPILQQLLQS